MLVICINDGNRPKQIPAEKWIVKGQTYTVIATSQMNLQRKKIGLKLKEIELDPSCFPYEYFDADRFKIVQPEISVAKQEVEEFAI
jgi:hypothetical protein